MYQTKYSNHVLCLVGRGAGPPLVSEKTRVGELNHYFLWGGGFRGEAGLRPGPGLPSSLGEKGHYHMAHHLLFVQANGFLIFKGLGSCFHLQWFSVT